MSAIGPIGDHLLISLCDVVNTYRTSALLKMHIPTRRLQWVDLGYTRPAVVSGKGMAMNDEYLFHVSLVASEENKVRTHLLVLSREDLRLVHEQVLSGVHDGHSIVVDGDRICVASTGTEQLVAYTLDGVEASGPVVIWSPTGAERDTQHVNSIALHDGSLLASAIGSRVQGSWAAAQHGYVVDVASGETVVTGLSHPHSLTSHDGRLTFCNSQFGSLNDADGPINHFAGYARGLAYAADGTTYVGTSVGRRPRNDPLRGQGAFHNPWTGGEPVGRCAVVELRPDGLRTEIGLTHLGSEIYDLMLW